MISQHLNILTIRVNDRLPFAIGRAEAAGSPSLSRRGLPNSISLPNVRALFAGRHSLLIGSGLHVFPPVFRAQYKGPALFFTTLPMGTSAAALQLMFPNQLRGFVSAIFLFILNMGGLSAKQDGGRAPESATEEIDRFL